MKHNLLAWPCITRALNDDVSFPLYRKLKW